MNALMNALSPVVGQPGDCSAWWRRVLANAVSAHSRTPIAIGALALLAVVATLPDYGFAIDEATYVWVLRGMRQWFAELPTQSLASSFSRDGLTAHWHFLEPPGARAVGHSNFNLPGSHHAMLVGWLLTHVWVDELTAYRLASAGLFAMACSGLTWVVGHRHGASAGAVAGLALLLSPRAFGHAHLAATETALSASWLAAVLACGRLLDASPAAVGRRSLTVGLFVALAAATKLTAWFLPFALAPWLLWRRPPGWRRAIAWSAVLSPLSIVVLTPPLWHDPIIGVMGMIQSAASNPWKIPTYYFGVGYQGAMPIGSGPILLAMTTPISILLMAALGVARAWRDPLASLAVVNLLALWGARVIGLMPTHDVDRQFAPAYPMVALLAGCGFAGLLAWIGLKNRATWSARLIGVSLAFICLSEPAVDGWTYRAHGLSYYNRMIGGLPGAARRGMELTYWCEHVTDADWRALQHHLPVGARVFMRPDHPGLDYLAERGLWRPDVRAVGPEEADFLLLLGKRSSMLLPDPAGGPPRPTDLLWMQDHAPAAFERRFLGARLLALIRR